MTEWEADRVDVIDERRLMIVQARAAISGRARRRDVLALCAELRTARAERDAARRELEGAYEAVRVLSGEVEALNGD